MTRKGHVENGVVVLEQPAEFEDGDEVSVRRARRRRGERQPTLYDELRPIIGRAKGLPADAARNHDHYLYGLPRK